MAQDTVVVAQHVRTQTSKLEEASSATELGWAVSTRSRAADAAATRGCDPPLRGSLSAGDLGLHRAAKHALPAECAMASTTTRLLVAAHD